MMTYATSSKLLTLKYVPLAWVAVLLTSLTIKLLMIIGIDLHTLATILNLSTTWLPSLIIYDSYQLVVVLLLIYLLRKMGVSLGDIGFKSTRKRYYVFAAILILVLASSVLWGFCDYIVSLLGLSMWWSKEPGTMIKTLSDLLVLSVCPVFLCSPLEEILYRGYLLTATLQRVRRVWLAFTINALVFASIHYAFGPGVMLFILLWTYIPCWLYYKSGSIYPSILFHSLNNLLAYVALPLLLTPT